MLLTPLQRRIWVLREFGGLGYSEIGRRVDLPRQSVYTLLKRTERKLAEALADSAEALRFLPLDVHPLGIVHRDRGWGRLARARRQP
ncbi:MAG TPA: sigma factor-like helix-turn-helix DNA-binding protein [Thermoplasmata archaeon]|nr:sigma factor-like helix-turn-helix DNA-binding protein [Thermoplasmata archaeon]